MLRVCDNCSGGNDNDCIEVCGGWSDYNNEGEDDGNGLVTAAMVARQWR
jgi:hypothetical protein